MPQLVGLICSIGLIWGLSLLLTRTRVGRGLRTIAEDSDTALLLGVDINRIVPIVFVISGLFAALAGVVFALNYRQVQPFMGEVVGLKGISAMIVGGMGNIWGSIAGGLIIGLVEVMSIGYFGADFVDIAVYGLLLLILFVRPTGLFAGTSTRAGARMSGYLEGILVLLAVNVVFAYGGFLPLAAGQLNLGARRLRGHRRLRLGLSQQRLRAFAAARDPVGGLVAGLVALAVAVPVLRTRGIYLALATFALGQIVQAIILNLEIVGGAAGYPVDGVHPASRPSRRLRRSSSALVWLLFATRFGIAVTAVHDDERVADLMGIDVRAFQIAAFVLGSAIAGHRRRPLRASFQLHRGAVFQHLAQHHDRALRAARRHPDRDRAAARRRRLHAAAGAAARQRATGATWCSPRP